MLQMSSKYDRRLLKDKTLIFTLQNIQVNTRTLVLKLFFKRLELLLSSTVILSIFTETGRERAIEVNYRMKLKFEFNSKFSVRFKFKF